MRRRATATASGARRDGRFGPLAALVLLAALGGAPEGAGADGSLEGRRAAAAAERLGLVPEPSPAPGERISFVRVVREDVFAEGEGPLSWLRFANALHARTRERVVRRELLLREGDGWDATLARESERNLRARGLFALVRVLAVRDRRGRLGLLAYARDLWSLRLEHALRITGPVVDELFVQLAERNVAGAAVRAGLFFRLDPVSWWAGGWVEEPRLGSEAWGDLRLALSAWGEVQHRRGGGAEGGRLHLSVGRPFYDLSQRWSWRLSGFLGSTVFRQLRGGELLRYDVPETAAEEAFGRAWRARSRALDLRATRRWRLGMARPSLAVGLRLSERRYGAVPDSGLQGADPAQRAAFARDVLPTDRAQLGPLLRYELGTTRYAEALELDAFARREPFALGPRLWMEAFVPLGLGAGWERGAVLQAGGEAAFAPLGGVLRLGLSAGARLSVAGVVDQRLRAMLRLASPVLLAAGRLVGRLEADLRRRDTTGALATLGGDDGLRGFPSQAFGVPGGSRLLAGLEARSRPLELWTVHLGLVAFVEGGTVYERWDGARWLWSAGLGLRLLLPQFNRQAYRFDAGLPLAGGGEGFVPAFGDGQAIGVLGSWP